MRGVWCVLVAVVSAVTAYNGNYNCVGGRDPVVHLFEWKYADVERECPWLANQGYCAVQVCTTQIIQNYKKNTSEMLLNSFDKVLMAQKQKNTREI